MKNKIRMRLCLGLLAFALSLTAITYATAKILRHVSAETKVAASQDPSHVARPNRSAYVRRGQLSARLALNLSALGNRLEKPGKERLTLLGTLRTDTAETREFAATLEFPDRLRLVVGGPQSHAIRFDGQQANAKLMSISAAELNLIETLSYRFAEADCWR